ncbi:MAG: type VI secretion system ATPase TssH, partial [bacterium]|nr:type VI secretion system ATPase TssH [bacterium]MDW8163875.1 Clp protease N-terminal domain-containing protein [Candidatus Omnitrophota bacterium]
MNLEKFTIKAQEVIMNTQAIAQERQNSEIDVAHLAYALIESDETINDILKIMNVDTEKLKNAISKEIEKLPVVKGEIRTLYISPLLNRVFYKAQSFAKSLGDEYISVEHLFLSLSDVDSDIKK